MCALNLHVSHGCWQNQWKCANKGEHTECKRTEWLLPQRAKSNNKATESTVAVTHSDLTWLHCFKQLILILFYASLWFVYHIVFNEDVLESRKLVNTVIIVINTFAHTHTDLQSSTRKQQIPALTKTHMGNTYRYTHLHTLIHSL